MKKKNSVKRNTASGNGSFHCTGLSPVDKEMEKFKLIILTIAMGYKKAKLGFTIKTADSEFWSNSVAIAAAIRLNKSGYYSKKFKDMYKWDALNIKFKKAVVSVKLGGLAKAEIKNTIKVELKGMLDDAVSYINKLARKNPFNSEAIVTGAKLLTCGTRRRIKQDLEARRGLLEGEVKLSTIAEKVNGRYVRTTYYWQYSMDGGNTWSESFLSDAAKYTFTDMPTGVKIFFRKKTLTSKGGHSAWCTPVDFTL